MMDPVKNHFDNLSVNYSRLFDEKNLSSENWIFNYRLNVIKNNIPKDIKSLLDCASGTGEITLEAAKTSNLFNIHINDFSKKMLDHTEKKFKQANIKVPVNYSNNNVFNLDYNLKRKFDCILCLGLLAHTGNLELLIKTLCKLTNKEGFIFFQSSLIDNLGMKTVRLFNWLRYKKNNGYQISYYSKSKLEKEFKKNGLKIIKCERYGLGFQFIIDSISRSFGYILEKKLKNYSKRIGMEAVYMLQKT